MGTRLSEIAMIALLADTGLRRAEIANLRVDQIQWLTEDLRGCLHDVVGKGDRMRLILFSSVVGQILRHYLEYRAALLHGMRDVQALFIQQSREPLQPVSVYQVLKRVAVKAAD